VPILGRYLRPLSVVAGLVGVISWSALAGAVADSGAVESAEPRVSLDLSHGWRFRQAAGLSGVESSAFDDSEWTAVELPHTWNRIGNEGTERSPLSNHVQGVGWYPSAVRHPWLIRDEKLLSPVRWGRCHRRCLAERTLSRQSRRSIFPIPFRCLGRDQTDRREPFGGQGRQ